MDKDSLKRFFLNESSNDERKFIIEWLLNPNNDQSIRNWMKEHWDLIDLEHASQFPDDSEISRIWQNIHSQIQLEQVEQEAVSIIDFDQTAQSNFNYRVKRILAAAAIITALVLTGTYFWSTNQPDNTEVISKSATQKNDIAAPDKNKAVLTLADGTVVDIENAGNGQLATQGNMKVTKNANGEIVYSGTSSNVVSFNTLSIPRGSKPIRLVLSDGSIVWLNAASSIKYPTAFIGSERKVTVTGEAYFEVAKNEKVPFLVANNDLLVKVMGTHFNVNAYDDENQVKVTLLEGAVQVSQGVKERLLQPGQQANIYKDNIKVQNAVNIDEVMSWKNDLFYFNGVDIKTIMRQIEKYYDVDVEFKDDINYQFVAKISRNVNVSKFLETLELTELVHFKIEANGKIIVSK